MSRERMHAEVSGIKDHTIPSGLEALNTFPVVDRLVRSFTREVIQRANSSPDYMSWLEFECRRMNGLFLGTSPSTKFERGAWNSEDMLGDFIGRALQINGETRIAVRDAFMIHASRAITIMQASDGKPDSEWQKELDLAVAQIREALLGNQPPLPSTNPL